MYSTNSTPTPATRDWTRGVLKPVTGKTFDEQLEAAGLNWEVKLSPMRFGDEFQYQTEKRKVAYRSDTGAFLDTYTKRQPWQNQDILGHFWTFCGEAGLTVDFLGYLTGDIVAMAKMETTGLNGDPTENWLMLRDSHSNGRGLSVALFRNRIVCTNAWKRHIKGSQRIISHVGVFSPDKIQTTLESALSTITQIDQTEQRLAETGLTDAQAHMQLIKAFGIPGAPFHEQPSLVQDMLILYKGKGQGSNLGTAFNSAYGLLQSVTEYYNWQQKGSGTMRGLGSILGGTRDQQMQKFNQQLVSVYC
jgi:hypothetical protein